MYSKVENEIKKQNKNSCLWITLQPKNWKCFSWENWELILRAIKWFSLDLQSKIGNLKHHTWRIISKICGQSGLFDFCLWKLKMLKITINFKKYHKKEINDDNSNQNRFLYNRRCSKGCISSVCLRVKQINKLNFHIRINHSYIFNKVYDFHNCLSALIIWNDKFNINPF